VRELGIFLSGDSVRVWTISVLRHFDSGALGTVLKYHKRLWEFKKMPHAIIPNVTPTLL